MCDRKVDGHYSNTATDIINGAKRHTAEETKEDRILNAWILI